MRTFDPPGRLRAGVDWSRQDCRHPRGIVKTRIEVFADIVCPFTHVGLRRLVEARDARSAHSTIRVRAWPLEWVNGRPFDAEVVGHEIEALRSDVAPEMFAGFDAAHFPRTSMPAFGLVAAAYRETTREESPRAWPYATRCSNTASTSRIPK